MTSELRTAAPAHATGAVVFVDLEAIAPDDVFRLRPVGDVSALAASIGRLGQLQPVELRLLPGAGAPAAAEDGSGGAPQDPAGSAAGGGPRYQVVAGFRRLAALGLLARDRVLARIHDPLGEEDAWSLALVQGLAGEPLAAEDLDALQARLRAGGFAAWAEELLEEARLRAPLPAALRDRFDEFLHGPLPAVGAGGEDDRAPEAPAAAAGRDGAPAAATAPAATPAAGEPAGPEPEPEPEEVDAEDFARDLAIRLAELNQDLATAHGAWKELPPEGRRLLLVQARYVADLLPYLEDAER